MTILFNNYSTHSHEKLAFPSKKDTRYADSVKEVEEYAKEIMEIPTAEGVVINQLQGASTAGLMEFRKNGSMHRRGAYTYHLDQSLDDYQLEGSIMVYMNGSSDYFEAWAFNVGTSNILSGGVTNSYFQGFLVGV